MSYRNCEPGDLCRSSHSIGLLFFFFFWKVADPAFVGCRIRTRGRDLGCCSGTATSNLRVKRQALRWPNADVYYLPPAIRGCKSALAHASTELCVPINPPALGGRATAVARSPWSELGPCNADLAECNVTLTGQNTGNSLAPRPPKRENIPGAMTGDWGESTCQMQKVRQIVVSRVAGGRRIWPYFFFFFAEYGAWVRFMRDNSVSFGNFPPVVSAALPRGQDQPSRRLV